MRSASLYRIGGNAMLAGALLYAVALLLHAPQPMDLAAYGALAQGRWMAAHWLFAVGSVFVAGGMLALAQAFATHVALDAVFFGRQGPLRGRVAVVAGWQRFFEGTRGAVLLEPGDRGSAGVRNARPLQRAGAGSYGPSDWDVQFDLASGSGRALARRVRQGVPR
jgi:hypothetical protein